MAPNKLIRVPEQTLLDKVTSRKQCSDRILASSFRTSISRWKASFSDWIETAEKVLDSVPGEIAAKRKRCRRQIVQIHICAIDSGDYADPWEFLDNDKYPSPDKFVGLAAILHDALRMAGLNPKIVNVNKGSERMFDLVITAN